jgi:hypothetical protein
MYFLSSGLFSPVILKIIRKGKTKEVFDLKSNFGLGLWCERIKWQRLAILHFRVKSQGKKGMWSSQLLFQDGLEGSPEVLLSTF